MRDLLTDLVRRARRPESTVQPRLPSAFEAAPVSHELVADRDPMHEPGSAPLPVPARSRAEPTRPPTRDVPDSAQPAPRTQGTAPPLDQAIAYATRVVRAGTPASPDVLPRLAPPATPLAQTTPPRAPVVAIAPATVPRILPPDIPAQHTPPRAVAPIQPVVRPDIGPRRQAHTDVPREYAGDTRDRPASDIRISIGRIEVRASAAERVPARRQPAAASASPLTLDEYLAARGRRGTR